MKIVEGDLLDQKGILCHQVSLRGIMGAGIALQIRRKWPSAHDEYVRHCRKSAKIGDVLYSNVEQEHVVVTHLFGQSDLSHGQCVTDYDSYPQMLLKVNHLAATTGLDVFIPHGIGCGLGRGDWNVMLPILEDHLPGAILVKYTEVK